MWWPFAQRERGQGSNGVVSSVLLVFLILLCLKGECFGFAPEFAGASRPSPRLHSISKGRMYGPDNSLPPPLNDDNQKKKDDDGDDYYAWDRRQAALLKQQEENYRSLIDIVTKHFATTPPEQNPMESLPSLLSRNVDLILDMPREPSVFNKIIEDALQEGGPEYKEQVEAILECILRFAEEFVHQAKQLDDHNKSVLGRILKAMSPKDETTKGFNYQDDDEDYERDDRTLILRGPHDIMNCKKSREEIFDELMEKEKQHFTPGFLRHIEGECKRIQSAPRFSRESARLLDVLHTIQLRVLEELGKDIAVQDQNPLAKEKSHVSKAALSLLGQLMGYEDPKERIAILEASLTVHGPEFGYELVLQTRQALLDFAQRSKEIDADLIRRVEQIHNAAKNFMEQGQVNNDNVDFGKLKP